MAESPFSLISCLDVLHTVELLSSENQHFMKTFSNIYILVKLLLEPHSFGDISQHQVQERETNLEDV